MSKTIAIRVSDEAHSALTAQCLATNQTMTELVLPHILGLIELPPAAADPLEARVMELETLTELQQTQLTQHKKSLDGVACELVALSARLDIIDTSANHLEHCFDQDTPDPKPEVIDLKPTEISAEPEQIGGILSPVSIRDLASAASGTSEFISLPSTSEFAQYVEPILKPYSSGGYYFRFEDVGQPELKAVLMAQAKQMGFSSQGVKIEGKATRLWLNRGYCKQLQTPNV